MSGAFSSYGWLLEWLTQVIASLPAATSPFSQARSSRCRSSQAPVMATARGTGPPPGRDSSATAANISCSNGLVDGQEQAVNRPAAVGRAMVLQFVGWRRITLQGRNKGRVRYGFRFCAPCVCQADGFSDRGFKGGWIDEENVGNAVDLILADNYLQGPAGIAAWLENGVVGGNFPGGCRG